MKVLSSSFVVFLDCGAHQPTHGVYSEAGWELLGDRAYPISLHWNYQAAVDAAARDEVLGHPRVVVCFDHSTFKARALEKRGRQELVTKDGFEADDSPHYGPEF